MTDAPLAIVLSGAAALGAYQVGVLDHLVTAAADQAGRPARVDIVSGTSAGAINGAALAAGADALATAVERLEEAWTALELGAVLRPSAIELVSIAAELGAAPARLQRALAYCGARGGLVDPRPIARLCEAAADPAQVAAHLAAGRLRAFAVAATQVATGRATVFFQAGAGEPTRAGTRMQRVAGVTAAHVHASAAVPLLFPPVAIDGEPYCDGGLRQLVPLSPALHLGARRVVMVSAAAPADAAPAEIAARRAAAGSPLYLAGKALDALFADGAEGDLDRLTQVNRILAAGARRFGPDFATQLDGELAALGAPPVRPVEVVHVRPSRDLATVAVEYLAEPAAARGVRGALGRAFRRLAEQDPDRAGGLLAYLLFDGGFAARLIALGRADARAHHRELVALLRGSGPALSG